MKSETRNYWNSENTDTHIGAQSERNLASWESENTDTYRGADIERREFWALQLAKWETLGNALGVRRANRGIERATRNLR